jgi:hypothetical protein
MDLMNSICLRNRRMGIGRNRRRDYGMFGTESYTACLKYLKAGWEASVPPTRIRADDPRQKPTTSAVGQG